MIKFYTILAALLVLSISNAFAATVQPDFNSMHVEYTMPEWASVGHDTCKVNPGCTSTWAMNSFRDAGMPASIAYKADAAFIAADALVAVGQEPDWETYYVCNSDVVASSFSNKHGELIMVREIKATFADCTPGLGWTFYDYVTGESYEVFRIIECGNYTFRVVTPAVAGYITSPLLTSFAPVRPYGHSRGGFAGGGFGGIGGGGSSSSGGDSFTNYLTQVTNITNVVNEFCAICCEPDIDNPDPEPPAPVPLPASGILMLAGLGGLAYLRRRKTS